MASAVLLPDVSAPPPRRPPRLTARAAEPVSSARTKTKAIPLPLPADLPAPQKLAAHASHWLLYGLMIALPLIGWAMLSAGGYPVMLSSSLRLPPILPFDPVAFAILRHLHTWLGLLLFLTFLAHLAAALYHGLIRRDGVLSSMTGVAIHHNIAVATAGTRANDDKAVL